MSDAARAALKLTVVDGVPTLCLEDGTPLAGQRSIAIERTITDPTTRVTVEFVLKPGARPAGAA